MMEGALNAFITELDAPGEGMRLAVKDLFDTAGIVTTYGSAIFHDHVPDRSATAVTQLEEAGYAIVGKTNLHEFAYGVTSENEHYGDVVNPLDPSRIPGGSSGGNGAALAAGLCDVALGTDSAGSIRLPAACCGVVGFKPTHGLVPTDGVFPLAPTFDHAGPMARSVGDCVAMLRPLADGHPLSSLEEVSLAVSWTEEAEPLVRERVEAAAALFPRRTQVDFPLPERFSPAFQREVADVHRELFAEHRDLYGENVRTKIERCFGVTDDEVDASLSAREAYRGRALEALGGSDLLLTPTMAFVAPPVGAGDAVLRQAVFRFTRPFNSLGWPALALPCGAAQHGLPASLQLVGPPRADSLVLAAGEVLERLLG
jgi:aspartyl-tRNA(Asn)/glutamyl-tRNA(Gln) amidotransferase subunit A